jgi:LysM repeat protein
MTQMKTIHPRVLWNLLILCYLVGCSKPMPEMVLEPTFTLKALLPYRTPTVTKHAPTVTPVESLPVTPVPSPTPFIHQVVSGETMLGIALRYGVTLEALQASNPEVDPRFLSVGAELIIPLGDEIQVLIATPTPAILDWDEPVCYRTGDGGAWCLLLVENMLSEAVENLSAWIGLFGEDGEIIASQVAVGPINILSPGQAMPLLAYFQSPLPLDFIIQAELLTAVEIAADDLRYLDWQLADLSVVIRGDTTREARITGTIEQPVGSSMPSQIWVAAVAYDLENRAVGMRKIDISGNLTFEMTVYSLGGPIERVEILTELRL